MSLTEALGISLAISAVLYIITAIYMRKGGE
jgi:hypothetical protein